MSDQPLTTIEISQRLSEGLSSQPPSLLWDFLTDEPRPAAVLVPLFCERDEQSETERWQILYTRRTDTVAEHQGQVAFPGGRADPTDTTPEMTALREAREEIGLDPLQVKILGRMNSLHTITNYLVTPIVGVIPWPFPFQLEESEVSHIFSIPLDWLADPSHHEIKHRSIPQQLSLRLKSQNHPVIYYQPYNNEVLWGVSAEITLRLVDILYYKKLADI